MGSVDDVCAEAKIEARDKSFVVTNNTNIINISIDNIIDVSFEIPVKRYSGSDLAEKITEHFDTNNNTNDLSAEFIALNETQDNIDGPTFYIKSAPQSPQKTYTINYEKTTARSLLGMDISGTYQITTNSSIERLYFGEGKANVDALNISDLIIELVNHDREAIFNTQEEVISNLLNGLSEEVLYNFNFGFRASVLSEGLRFSSGARYGFISINDYKIKSKSEIQIVYNDSVLDDHIIARMNLIPITANTLSLRDSGMSKLLNKTRRYKVPVDIQKFTIKLYDEYGRIIDLNNMDWSFTLEFEKEGGNLSINETS
tara:strand:+ start:705 stop:1649 length:945 start_codon:yes stop_codon:yes gene_type:complete